MLKRLQDEYAGKPVRFLLFPCNQFDSQEPGSNKEVKAFAEKSVKLGAGSNVIMFAKSNLNGVPCGARGKDACTPSSASCCPTNDPVYEYLLSATPPGQIQWNFDKVVVDGSGKPFPGETIVHGGDTDAAVIAAISLAAEGRAGAQALAARPAAYQPAVVVLSVTVLLGLAVGAWSCQPRKQQQQDYIRLV